MKSRIFTLSAVLFLFSIFYSVKAKANGDYTTFIPDSTTNSTPANSPTTALPINKGIVFLAIAGIIIGIVAVRKYKSVKTTI